MMRQKVLEVPESSGYPGIGKMQKCLTNQCHNILKAIIDEVAKGCQCKRADPLKTTSQMVQITADRPFHRVQIDLIDLRAYSDLNLITAAVLSYS